MDKVPIEKFQENLDEYLDRVESGESFIITSEHGSVVLSQPQSQNSDSENDDLIRIYTDHEEGC